MIPERCDVLIAGARCAGAATAMLLARAGLRVLVVDPLPRGSDTLSTHALMRGAVLQLHRWGLLAAIRDADTPAIRATTFHYGDDAIEIPIKPAQGVDALYAPRRTALDSILVGAAIEAGAQFAFGYAVRDLLRGSGGAVAGAVLSDPSRRTTPVKAELVIGADGVRSRVARSVGAPLTRAAEHSASVVYGYWSGLPNEGNHWFYEVGLSAAVIPTNSDSTCVGVMVPRERFEARRHAGLDQLHESVVSELSPALAASLAAAGPADKMRGFQGISGFFRKSAGPGWALVGDAGYFKDPITAHGITDALRDAEQLARAVIRGGEGALLDYEKARDEMSEDLLEITDRIASFDWDLEEVKELHLVLSRSMKAEVEHLLSLA